MKHKTLLCLILIIFVGLSIFSMKSLLIKADNQPVLSAVLSGTTSNTVIPAATIGSTISVDIRVDNIGGVTQGINALSYKVTYDTAVLSLTNQGTKGPFWGSAVNDLTDIVTTGTGNFVESAIILNLGNFSESTTINGVVRTLTFTVLSAGQSNINIEPSDSGIAYLTYPDGSGGSIDVTANAVNAIYGGSPSPSPTSTTSPSPTPSTSPIPTPTPSSPHGPNAKINVNNGTIYQVGSVISLNGGLSDAGYDGQSCPITNYTWLIQYQNNTVFGIYYGQSLTFTVSNPTYLNVTLIATGPDVNPNPSPSYIQTSTISIWIYVQPIAQPQIDLSTNRGGIGAGVNSGGFSPDELIDLYACVTYNAGSVENRLVAFTVLSPNGTIIIPGQVATTNSTGYAHISYRTPWLGESNFGIWTVKATVEVSQIIVTDTLNFTYNYPIVINDNGISVPASAHRLDNVTISVSIQNLANSYLWRTTTFTIFDDAHVPIGAIIVPVTNQTGTQTVSATLTIPSWAFVGTATVSVNFLTDSPANNGVPICPEKTATFQIVI